MGSLARFASMNIYLEGSRKYMVSVRDILDLMDDGLSRVQPFVSTFQVQMNVKCFGTVVA
jgi:hypothetical protein